MRFDTIDKKLLQLLQQDSKQTNKELSNKLNLSVTAVYERIKKLEREEVIYKYVALVNKKTVNKSFVAFCQIKLVQHSQDYVIKFERDVAKLNEVMECYHISGDFDEVQRKRLAEVSERCPVHKTLANGVVFSDSATFG